MTREELARLIAVTLDADGHHEEVSPGESYAYWQDDALRVADAILARLAEVAEGRPSSPRGNRIDPQQDQA